MQYTIIRERRKNKRDLTKVTSRLFYSIEIFAPDIRSTILQRL